MHELSIVDALLTAALEEAARRGATRIVNIHCRVGRLRQVDHQLLGEVFNIARQGTLAAEAVLTVTSEGMRLVCGECRRCADLDDWRFDCPSCGSADIALSGGDEIELTSLELEVADDYCCPAQEPL